MAHQGSFGDIPLETRATAPRERVTISLPHWPFSDDLDLIQQPLPEAATDTTVAAPAQHVGDAVSGEASPERSADSFPIRVAEVPAPPATPETPAPPATPRQPAEAVAAAPQPEPDPIQNLKSIKDIQPFYDYAPQGGDPNESLCPRPAGADPNKTYKECPVESELMLQGSLERNHSIIPVYWQASNVSHNPLYFEDSGLERNGHSFSNAVQPFVSAGKFGAQVIALPYTVALDPVWKRETPLGHYRPGECAPKRHLALPINGRAAVVAAATYTGIIYLIP